MLAEERGMVGKFFHTFHKNGSLCWQGHVTDKITDEYYLVELFEWGLGYPSYSKVVNVKDMYGWRFYDDAEQMNYQGEELT